MTQTKVFKARPSAGWVWLGGLGILFLFMGIGTALIETPLSGESLLSLLLSGGLGIYFIALAAWFPTLRYELDEEALTLIYGPVLRYRIPLQEIREMQRTNLKISLWSSMRMPGIALFVVPYRDIGRVKMCATAAATDILLIQTDHGQYGITPLNEEALIKTIQQRIKA